jgi:heme A synthase
LGGQNIGVANNRKRGYMNILRKIQTPLGLYVLALLIIEGTLGLVLTLAKLPDDKRWSGFLLMIAVFAAVVLIVTALTFWNPKNLLY